MTHDHCQVAIVGRDLTSYSAYYHLKKLGVQQTLHFHCPCNEQNQPTPMQIAINSGLEHFTRWHHNFGFQKATKIKHFYQESFHELSTFLYNENIPHQQGSWYKAVRENFEDQEINKSIKLLAECSDNNWEVETYPNPSGLKRFYKLSQGSLIFSQQQLFNKLLQTTKRPAMTSISFEDEVKLHSPGFKKSMQPYIVVLTCGHCMINTIPNMHEHLIPYADQGMLVKTNRPIPFKTGSTFTINNGYEWVRTLEKNQLEVGGARFLRPLAGIGAAKPSWEKKVEEFCLKRSLSFLDGSQPFKVLKRSSWLDFRPSDEHPLIGPYFTDSKLLISCGFSGQESSLGFSIGRCLAELILDGKSSSLPRFFWPERLRHLE